MWANGRGGGSEVASNFSLLSSGMTANMTINHSGNQSERKRLQGTDNASINI